MRTSQYEAHLCILCDRLCDILFTRVYFYIFWPLRLLTRYKISNRYVDSIFHLFRFVVALLLSTFYIFHFGVSRNSVCNSMVWSPSSQTSERLHFSRHFYALVLVSTTFWGYLDLHTITVVRIPISIQLLLFEFWSQSRRYRPVFEWANKAISRSIYSLL